MLNGIYHAQILFDFYFLQHQLHFHEKILWKSSSICDTNDTERKGQNSLMKSAIQLFRVFFTDKVTNRDGVLHTPKWHNVHSGYDDAVISPTQTDVSKHHHNA